MRTDTDTPDLEALAREIAEQHGRASWVLLVEDDRGELRAFAYVGTEGMRALFKRWERQEREATR